MMATVELSIPWMPHMASSLFPEAILLQTNTGDVNDLPPTPLAVEQTSRLAHASPKSGVDPDDEHA